MTGMISFTVSSTQASELSKPSSTVSLTYCWWFTDDSAVSVQCRADVRARLIQTFTIKCSKLIQNYQTLTFWFFSCEREEIYADIWWHIIHIILYTDFIITHSTGFIKIHFLFTDIFWWWLDYLTMTGRHSSSMVLLRWSHLTWPLVRSPCHRAIQSNHISCNFAWSI